MQIRDSKDVLPNCAVSKKSIANSSSYLRHSRSKRSKLHMALAYGLPQNLLLKKSNSLIAFQVKSSLSNQVKPNPSLIPVKRRCLRCNTLYQDKDNSPTACSFHGHTNGEKGLFSLAPPHQGVDGEWSDRSGVIVYKWNDKGNRPNTGSANWKKRWSCCSEYDENASPCRRGWHVSYDDGFTLY